MVLSAHAVVGGAIGAVLRGHPLLAFAYGFVSHFILDMIPHYDYPIRSGFVDPHGESKEIKGRQIIQDGLSIGLDLVVGMVLAFIFFGQGGDASFAWAWGAVGAIVPDALQFVYGLWKKPPLSWLQKIHEGVHTPYRFKTHPVQGVIVQIVFVVLVITGMGNYFEKIERNILVPAIGQVDAEQSAKEAPVETASTTILFLGDMMLGRHVEKLSRNEGFDYPFRLISGFLAERDYVIGNLEGPIRRVHVPTPINSFAFSFDPIVAQILASSSITAVSLANNHTWDGGSLDYDHTINVLRNSGVGYFGHPVVATSSVYEIVAHGKTVKLLGFNPTYPTFKLADAEKVVQDMKAGKEENIVIPYLHWGDEYEPINNTAQRQIAEALVNAGADVIIGAHPHVVQNIEVINGVPVVYSLGNFIFDQYFSAETQEGLLAEIEIRGDNMLLRIYKIRSVQSQPYIAETDTEIYEIDIK